MREEFRNKIILEFLISSNLRRDRNNISHRFCIMQLPSTFEGNSSKG